MTAVRRGDVVTVPVRLDGNYVVIAARCAHFESLAGLFAHGALSLVPYIIIVHCFV